MGSYTSKCTLVQREKDAMFHMCACLRKCNDRLPHCLLNMLMQLGARSHLLLCGAHYSLQSKLGGPLNPKRSL